MSGRLPPEFMFGYVETGIKLECYFCDENIDPLIDFLHVEVSIPSKVLLQLHQECFEQMAWSMTYFLFNVKPAEPIVN